jgi:hypothetical protein
MYIANYTHPDILFSVNLLAWYSSSLTRRHWNELRIFVSLEVQWIYYSKVPYLELISYADAGYMSDSHKGRSPNR